MGLAQKKHDKRITQDAQRELKKIQAEADKLREKIESFEHDSFLRKQAQKEYNRLVTKIDEMTTADPSSKTSDSLEINWLCTLENGECRRASVVIPDFWEHPIIFAKGDEQLGHVTCDEDRVKKDIAWVERNSECLVFLLGDAIDSATKTSPGSIRENNLSPLRQIDQYLDLHQSIKDRIIGYVGGNHERRIDKALDDSGAAVRLIARGLSGPNHKVPYSGGILLVDVHWRGHVWTFTLFHGAGAAQTPGSKIQRMQRNMLLSDSMITLSGHLHDEAKTSRRYVKRAVDGSVRVVKQTALQCGTYLQYIGSYGEVGGMSPVGPDMIVIELFPDGKYADKFKGESDI